VASAYFTVNAFALLRRQLESLGRMCFLFGQPQFVKSLDPTRASAGRGLSVECLLLSCFQNFH